MRDLTEKADNWLQRQLKHHDRDMMEYNVVKRNIDRITDRIRNTLAPEHQHFTADILDTRSQLIALRDRFSSAEKERMIEVRILWDTHARSSVKDSPIDLWLTTWDNLYTEAVSAGVPDVKDAYCAAYDFLTAIRSLDETYYQIWYQKVFREPGIIPFTIVVNAFRQQRAASNEKGLVVSSSRPSVSLH